MRTLVLVGSGEFTRSMEAVDRYLMSRALSQTVAILPTAAGQEEYPEEWIAKGVIHFQKLGAEPFGIPILKREDTRRTDHRQHISQSSLIYFSGGEPSFLREVLWSTSLWKLIHIQYQKGIILAGSSAGAMCMGAYVLDHAQDVFMSGYQPVNWKKSFSLIPYIILPHYDWALQHRPRVMKHVLDTTPNAIKRARIGIDEDTALVITNERETRVMGKGAVHVFHDEKETVIKRGKSFRL